MRRAVLIILVVLSAGILSVYFYQDILGLYYRINPMAQSPDKQHIYNMATTSTNRQNQIYVALGDSLTAGVGVQNYSESYPYLVAKILSKENNVQLINYSVSGYTSGDLIEKLLDKAIEENPDMVTLLVGTNDILQNVSAEQFDQNYSTILDQLTKGRKARIYVISIPFIGDKTVFTPPYDEQIDQKVRAFNEIVHKQARSHGVKYIDIYTPTVAQFKQSGSHYSGDNFHPSAEGYALWANLIYDDINP